MPGPQDAREAELLVRYATILVALDELDEEASFEEVDALIESRLK